MSPIWDRIPLSGYWGLASKNFNLERTVLPDGESDLTPLLEDLTPLSGPEIL
jgi:hypothetical protein